MQPSTSASPQAPFMESSGSDSHLLQATGKSGFASRVKWKFAGFIVWRFVREDDGDEEEEEEEVEAESNSAPG